jgi:hypothetical protein
MQPNLNYKTAPQRKKTGARSIAFRTMPGWIVFCLLRIAARAIKRFLPVWIGFIFALWIFSHAIPVYAETLDSDGWEDQDFNSDQGTAWVTDAGTGGTIQVTSEMSQAGTYSVEMGNAAYNSETIELAVDTTGYKDITVSYYRAKGGTWEAADYFEFEWYDGTGWHQKEIWYDDWKCQL